MFDTGLADRIRAKGVPVVEVAGWRTRGSSSYDPWGAIDHHTAGGASGTIPSLNVLINGRSDLPGPLCQVGQSREAGEGNDKAYVIAAGRANHGGTGSWRGLSGNSRFAGLEMEHTGTSKPPAHRLETAARITAAMLEAPGASRDSAWSCQHSEYAPGRKIDIATGFETRASRDEFRNKVAYWIGRTAGPTPPSPKDDDMPWLLRNNSNGAIYLMGDPTLGPVHLINQTTAEDFAAKMTLVNVRHGGDAAWFVDRAAQVAGVPVAIAEDIDAIRGDLADEEPTHPPG